MWIPTQTRFLKCVGFRFLILVFNTSAKISFFFYTGTNVSILERSTTTMDDYTDLVDYEEDLPVIKAGVNKNKPKSGPR